LPKRILAILSLLLIAMLGAHTTTLAAIQIGMGGQLKNDQVSPTTDLSWWLTDNWAIRADYSWNDEDLGIAALYKINPRSKTAVYIGLAENDLTGKIAPELPPQERVGIIAGMEWDLSRLSSGLSVTVEAGINPTDFTNKSGDNDGLASRLGISLNYRFPTPKAPKKFNNQDNVLLLAKLITLEAPNEPFAGQVAVAAVVLNRTRNAGFPGSVPAVIYEPGQFAPAARLAKTVPNQSAIKAAQKALQGSDPSRGALYFYNPAISSAKARRYFQSHYRVTARIGNHVFLK
jgi:N-acetylmuramoyl-L-alanine amidase